MTSKRLSILTVAWSLVFAAVHAYWAAGGPAGMGGDPAETAGEQAYIAVIAGLGLAGALVAHRRAARLARIGGAVLLLGVLFGTGSWVADGGIGDDGAAGVVVTAWFLVGGVPFTLLGRPGRGGARRSGRFRPALGRGTGARPRPPS